MNIEFLKEAVRLSDENMKSGKGGPFGCVIVKDGKIIAKGSNLVTSSNDPTAHAEIVAIREACKTLNTFQLTGCELYTSCEPCPMCLGAIYWARPDKVCYANTREDAAAIGFDDEFIYQEIAVPVNDRKILFQHVVLAEAKQVFRNWKNNPDRKEY
jgi:tRNA(Arg) A34 adenosine deaminase TadA